jgi:hypothetical protein
MISPLRFQRRRLVMQNRRRQNRNQNRPIIQNQRQPNTNGIQLGVPINNEDTLKRISNLPPQPTNDNPLINQLFNGGPF